MPQIQMMMLMKEMSRLACSSLEMKMKLMSPSLMIRDHLSHPETQNRER
jgi:hypothetical protein